MKKIVLSIFSLVLLLGLVYFDFDTNQQLSLNEHQLLPTISVQDAIASGGCYDPSTGTITCAGPGNFGCCLDCIPDPFGPGGGCQFTGNSYHYCVPDGLGSCGLGGGSEE